MLILHPKGPIWNVVYVSSARVANSSLSLLCPPECEGVKTDSEPLTPITPTNSCPVYRTNSFNRPLIAGPRYGTIYYQKINKIDIF